jgi:hypothetical protein
MRLHGFLVFFLVATASQAPAQTVSDPAEGETETEIAEKEAKEADYDGSLDDASSSIDVRDVLEGVSLSGDVRVGYSYAETDERTGGNSSEDVTRARWRLRSEMHFLPYLRAVARVAGLCSSEECEPNLILEQSIPTNNGIADGDITLDEAYFHWFRLQRFDIALGRMQTRFVARGGVFAKSLDRNDSNNVNVNWTDGLHATFRTRTGWVPHLILQHNSPDGATNIRRGPLNFDDPGARITYFVGLENLERTPYFLQRALDISYLPKSLLKDGALSGRREDYYGIVIRSANRWPERDEGIRLRVAAEVGYAPETQTKMAAGIAGDGDADGLAWNVVLSLMDFAPSHSIGVNYGRVGAGWLLSPQFRQNESLAEVRYQWRKTKRLALDFRIRQREELEQLAFGDRRRKELDFFVRFTWGWSTR